MAGLIADDEIRKCTCMYRSLAIKETSTLKTCGLAPVSMTLASMPVILKRARTKKRRSVGYATRLQKKR